MENQPSNDEKIRYRICPVGADKVGKTTLLERIIFHDMKFSLKLERNKKEECRSFLLYFHDNPKESYLSLSDGIILIYDITNKNTFDELDEFFQGFKDSKQYKYCSFMVVGNKSDQSAERVVQKDDVAKYCKKNKLI